MTTMAGWGVVDGMPEAEYFAHPALSSSGARKLLPPSCPALYRWERDNPAEPKKEFDLGKAAHRMVLGEGPDFVVVDHADWRTKDAKEKAAEARAASTTPILRHQYDELRAMAAALRAHPWASALFRPGTGRSEVSLFARDEATGVELRSRLDRLPHAVPGRRLLVSDYKSAASAEPTHVSRALYNFGYAMQADFYLSMLARLGLAPDGAAFLFVFQEKTAPYLVNVVQVDDESLAWANRRNRKAINIFRRCLDADRWPGWADDGPMTLGVPGFVLRSETFDDEPESEN